MINALGQNARTGPKIMGGGVVKREQMKDFVTAFLMFLVHWREGHIAPDLGRFYPDDVNTALREFVPGGERVHWEELCEPVENAPKES